MVKKAGRAKRIFILNINTTEFAKLHMGLVVLVKKNVSPHYSQHGLRQIRAVSWTIAVK
jgi:hypothetical protein